MLKSNTCIPARSIFSPIQRPDICPLASERWELRTRTFGCNISTRNLLSIITAVVATLLVVAILAGVYVLYKRRQRRREWLSWGNNSGSNFGFWDLLGLEGPFLSTNWSTEAWGGWTWGWLPWKRDVPVGRIPGAWEDAAVEEERERRPLLG